MHARLLRRLGILLRRSGEKLSGLAGSDTAVPRAPDESATPPSGDFGVFLTPEASAINKARLDHLASLGLDLSNKKVLEVGAGIGLHTEFFERRGCDVLSTDGNPGNVAEMMRRYPGRRACVLDLDLAADISHLGGFDIVYCYGTLYHLSKPEQALKALSQVCREMILLETCVSLGEHTELVLVREQIGSNMSVRGLGCRPTRSWVVEMLRKYFGHGYATRTQPAYSDFETDWDAPAAQLLHRAVFVGSRRRLENPQLHERLPHRQERVGAEGPAPPRWQGTAT